MKRKFKKNIGLIIGCLGFGIILAVVVPIWGWLIVVGGGLVYAGWYISKHFC